MYTTPQRMSVQPDRPGVYRLQSQYRYGVGEPDYFAYFDGENWCDLSDYAWQVGTEYSTRKIPEWRLETSYWYGFEQSPYTDWAPLSEPPTRPGVYEIDYVGKGMVREFCYFDGKRWGGSACTTYVATEPGIVAFDWMQSKYWKDRVKWRGLNFSPKYEYGKRRPKVRPNVDWVEPESLVACVVVRK